MATVELPSYTPSDRAPAYRSKPRGDEKRLAIAQRTSAPRRPIASGSSVPTPSLNGTNGISFTLDRRKEEDASIVIDETVSGQVSLRDLGDVKAVYLVVSIHLRLSGTMKVSFQENHSS